MALAAWLLPGLGGWLALLVGAALAPTDAAPRRHRNDDGRGTVLFVGWFGPRELASLVFALITMEELGAAADDAVAVITGTVLLSVVVHGISAAPLAARYGRSAATRERLVTPRG